jgi:hypothetical protein
MANRPDIAIVGQNGASLAIVEVKNLPELGAAAATRVRDALIENLGRSARYLLVLSQESGFIWELAPSGDVVDQGGERLSMRPVLREYLTDAELDRRIRGAELELVFSHWFGDLARGRVTRPDGAIAGGPFDHFLSDVRGAQVLFQTPA